MIVIPYSSTTREQKIFRARHSKTNGVTANRAIKIGREAMSEANDRAFGPTNSVPRRMLYQLKPEDTIDTASEAVIPAARFGVRIR